MIQAAAVAIDRPFDGSGEARNRTSGVEGDDSKDRGATPDERLEMCGGGRKGNKVGEG